MTSWNGSWTQAVAGGSSGASLTDIDWTDPAVVEVLGTSYDDALSSWGNGTFDYVPKINVRVDPNSNKAAMGGRFFPIAETGFDYSLYDGCLVRVTWDANNLLGTHQAGLGVALTSLAAWTTDLGRHAGFMQGSFNSNDCVVTSGEIGRSFDTRVVTGGSPVGKDGDVTAWFPFTGDRVSVGLASVASGNIGAGQVDGQQSNTAYDGLWLSVFGQNNYHVFPVAMTHTGVRVQYMLIPKVT